MVIMVMITIPFIFLLLLFLLLLVSTFVIMIVVIPVIILIIILLLIQKIWPFVLQLFFMLMFDDVDVNDCADDDVEIVAVVVDDDGDEN